LSDIFKAVRIEFLGPPLEIKKEISRWQAQQSTPVAP